MQKIVPHLWYDTQAREAAEFYAGIFPDSKIVSSFVLRDTPSGECEALTFNLNGHDFMAISAGPYFEINPSISFIVNFDPSRDDQAREHLDEIWEALMAGGMALMPLDEYPFSKHYGWVRDKYGVTWQLMLTDPAGDPRPYIIPTLMFTRENTNRAEEAMNFYVATFGDAKTGTVARYPEKMGSINAGSLMFADFMLEGQWFAIMDSGEEHEFTFNEAVSLLVNCDDQNEIDTYWEKISSAPESEQCGWCKDKFGVSWQISPTVLNDMMDNGTQEQIDRVTQAFMPMKKLVIADIEAAYKGA